MKMLKSQCVAFVLFSAYTGYAFGFWSVVGQNHHKKITIDGLKQVSYFHEASGRTLKFKDDAIQKIVDQNTKADQGATKTLPHFHFDNGALSLSYRTLMSHRNVAISYVSLFPNPWIPLFLNGSYHNLGLALHSAQDFYSHSTWSDRGNRNIVDFAVSNIPNVQDDAEDVCGFGSPHLVLTTRLINNQPRPIATGHYKDDNNPLPSTEEQKCHHGSLFQHATSPQCAPIGVEGIAKDDMDCNDRNMEAGRLATEETKAFVQSIIDELGTNNKVDGICALMGIAEIDCPDGFRITKATYYPRIHGVDGGTSFGNPCCYKFTDEQEIYWEGDASPPLTLMVRHRDLGATDYNESTDFRCIDLCDFEFKYEPDGLSTDARQEFVVLDKPLRWKMFCGDLTNHGTPLAYSIWLVDSEGRESNEVQGFQMECVDDIQPFPTVDLLTIIPEITE